MRMRVALGVIAVTLLLAGCGGTGSPPHGGEPAAAGRALTAEKVVLDWSDALNHGLNDEAAVFFAPGARVENGDGRFVILRDRDDAVLFNASIACQGRIVGMAHHDDRVTAWFVLDQRGTFACPHPGNVDGATFTIRHGKIVVWELLP